MCPAMCNCICEDCHGLPAPTAVKTINLKREYAVPDGGADRKCACEGCKGYCVLLYELRNEFS